MSGWELRGHLWFIGIRLKFQSPGREGSTAHSTWHSMEFTVVPTSGVGFLGLLREFGRRSSFEGGWFCFFGV